MMNENISERYSKLYVRFVPYTGSSKPNGFDPVENNLKMDIAYRVIDINSYADDREAYFGIVDIDGRPIWISNRYLRVIDGANRSATDYSYYVSEENLISWSYNDAYADFGDLRMPIEKYKLKTAAKEYLEWHRARWSN